MAKILVLLSLLAPTVAPKLAFAVEPLEGEYRLTGTNPGSSDRTYGGTVEIRRSGESYRLRWKIGPEQSQDGQGPLEAAKGGAVQVPSYDPSTIVRRHN